MPLVSVLMVCHRDSAYVRAAVASVFAQTLTDLELVFVDNASGMTPEDLGESGRDARLRWLPQMENRGISGGVTIAVNAACGEFVALLDSDDIALPERLEKQVAAMRAQPHLGMVFSVANTIDEQGAVIGREFTLLSERDQREFSAYNMPAATPTYLCRREVLRDLTYRDCFEVAGDYDMFTRLTDTMPTMALPDVLVHYRRYAQQATVERRSLQELNACIIRLLTARRRAGRDEQFAETISAFQDWLAAPPDLAVQYAHFARRCLDERFPLLAVYFARRLLSASRAPSRLLWAARVLIMALVQAPEASVTVLRMFFTGPLRTLGLRPA